MRGVREMEVRIRHIDETTQDSRPFAEAKDESKVCDLIDYINRCGGVYISERGDTFEFNSFQIVIDGSTAYVEIIVGEE
jgi:hypothetical protein